MAKKNSKKGASRWGASPDPKENDVKIPVEGTESEEAAQDGGAQGAEAAPQAAAEGDGAPLSEEELVAAAIRAGEEAAANDVKLKYDKAVKELESVRKELADAADAAEAAEAKAKEAVERQQRLQADWENYRRRTAQERLDERERATEKLVTSLLPVVDDIERALTHAKGQEMGDDFKQFVDGVSAVYSKLMGVFVHEGVEAIDPAGDAFDPNIHQAVGRVNDPDQYDETVNDVYQKGYRMGGKVLRPAMVTVTYGGAPRPAEEPEAEGEATAGGAEGSKA